MIALLLAAALVLPIEAQPIPVGTAAAWLSVGAAADQWSTGWAIGQAEAHGKRWRELAPLGQSVEMRTAAQFAFVGAGALLVHEVSKRDPQKGRRMLKVMVGVKVAAGLWAVGQGLKARR